MIDNTKNKRKSPRRRRYYAVEKNGTITKVHTFRTESARDVWLFFISHDALYLEGGRTYRAATSDDPVVRQAYRNSKRCGSTWAYQEH